jgi:hypothetical protein
MSRAVIISLVSRQIRRLCSVDYDEPWNEERSSNPRCFCNLFVQSAIDTVIDIGSHAIVGTTGITKDRVARREMG